MKDRTAKTSSCFVLMPSDPGLLSLWNEVICPAIEQTGLVPLRGGGFEEIGPVEHMRQILLADLVVVVITGNNFNVMYELGIAHAAKKKVLLLKEKGGHTSSVVFPGLLFMEYDPLNFPKSRETLAKALANIQIEETDDLFPELLISGVQTTGSKLPALLVKLSPEEQEKSGSQHLPISLKRFEIRDFQCIKDTGMEHLPADAPWILITGDNGDGKTSLLQALAIGLNGPEDAEQRLKSNRAARIGVEIREEGDYVVRDFSLRNDHWILTDHNGDRIAPVINLVTYGPARLDLSGESSRADEVAERTPVYSLLQQRGNLRNIEYWLKMRTLDATGGERGAMDEPIRQRVKRVKEVLVNLMPGVTCMELVGSKFKYTEKGHVVDAHNLSAGQLSILAMVGDLLIRLYESQPDAIDPKELKGIVLIDELDVHLHPTRQKELPSQLSGIFPNVQFVATTHSVIPVMGAPKGSVFLRVVRDPSKGTRVEQPDIEIGNLLPNAVLTSPLFEMDSILAKQNIKPEDVRTDDNYADAKRKRQVDEALARLAKEGNILPKGFLDPEE